MAENSQRTDVPRGSDDSGRVETDLTPSLAANRTSRGRAVAETSTGIAEVNTDIAKRKQALEDWKEKVEEMRENALETLTEKIGGFFESGGENEDVGRDSAEDPYGIFKRRVYEENRNLIDTLFDRKRASYSLADDNFTIHARETNGATFKEDINFNLNIISATLVKIFEYYSSLSKPKIQAMADEESMKKPTLSLDEMRKMDSSIGKTYQYLNDFVKENEGTATQGNAAFLKKYTKLAEGNEIDNATLADLIRQVFDASNEIGKSKAATDEKGDTKNEGLRENIAQEALLVSFVNRMDRGQKHELIQTILTQYPDHAPKMIREMVTKNFLSVREAKEIMESALQAEPKTLERDYKYLYDGAVTKEIEEANRNVQKEIERLKSSEEGTVLLDRFTVTPTKGAALVLGTLYSGIGLLLNAVVNRHLIYTRNGWNFTWVGDFETFLSNPSLTLLHAPMLAACIEYGTDKVGIMGHGAIAKFLATPRWGALKEKVQEDQLREFFSQYELYAGVGTYLENHFDAIKVFVDGAIMKEVTDEDGNKTMIPKSNPEKEIKRAIKLSETGQADPEFQGAFPKNKVAALDGLSYEDAVNKLVELYLKVTTFHLDDYPITNRAQLKDFIHEVRGD